MRVGKTICTAIALVALIGGAASAHAGVEDDYAAGLKALDQGRTADARKYLQRAFDAQSEPMDKINLDGNWQPYLPLHFLGVVAYRLGDCSAAGNYWNSPNNRRMTARFNILHQQEQQLLATCKPAAASTAGDNAPKPTDKNTAPPANTNAAAPVPAPLAKPTPPDALMQALQNYIGGRYLTAARIDPTAMSEPRAKFHAYVIRSAARFMLANTGGDAGLLDGARADALAARALDPHTAPDPATFPPKFRAFYTDAH